MNHVANVVQALLLIGLEAKLEGESYNVASGEQISIGGLAKSICRSMGLSPKFLYSGQVRAGEAQKWYPNHTRLLSLGYENRISLRDGLADTVAWFRGEVSADQAED